MQSSSSDLGQHFALVAAPTSAMGQQLLPLLYGCRRLCPPPLSGSFGPFYLYIFVTAVIKRPDVFCHYFSHVEHCTVYKDDVKLPICCILLVNYMHSFHLKRTKMQIKTLSLVLTLVTPISTAPKLVIIATCWIGE